MCNANARVHRRVAKDGWRAGEVVEESNSGAKKNRRDVDADFVEEASVQQLLDGVSAEDPNGLPGGGGSDPPVWISTRSIEVCNGLLNQCLPEA